VVISQMGEIFDGFCNAVVEAKLLEREPELGRILKGTMTQILLLSQNAGADDIDLWFKSAILRLHGAE